MKKDETRFTIRFNPVDPRHQRAMEALAAAGRRKASLIADAVCEYLARYGTDASAVTLSPAEQTLPTESLKAIRMEAREEKTMAAFLPAVADPIIQETGDNSESPDELPFDEDMRQAVLGGLNMFKG